MSQFLGRIDAIAPSGHNRPFRMGDGWDSVVENGSNLVSEGRCRLEKRAG
jgi:hypothetical protein